MMPVLAERCIMVLSAHRYRSACNCPVWLSWNSCSDHETRCRRVEVRVPRPERRKCRDRKTQCCKRCDTLSVSRGGFQLQKLAIAFSEGAAFS